MHYCPWNDSLPIGMAVVDELAPHFLVDLMNWPAQLCSCCGQSSCRAMRPVAFQGGIPVARRRIM